MVSIENTEIDQGLIAPLFITLKPVISIELIP